MNSKLRQRTIKNFIASVLISDLSEADINEVARDLIHGSLGREIGEVLKEMTALSGRSTEKSPKLGNGPRSSQALRAYEAAKKRRLSRQVILSYMSSAAPSLPKKFFAMNAPLRDALEKFFENASPNEAASFVNILNGEPSDPYLTGIVGRNKG